MTDPETKEVVRPKSPKWALTLEEKRLVFEQALPSDIDPDRFLAIAKKHIGEGRNLADAFKHSPKTAFSALLSCATDGLLLDGKQAALTAFKNNRSGNYDVTYMPMVRGIVDRLYRSGRCESIHVKVVRKGDLFTYSEGTAPSIQHEPQFQSTEVTHAYCIVWLKGAKFPSIDVMGSDELMVLERMAIKKVGGPDKSWRTPWGGDFKQEMQKKSVLKRLAKTLPLSASDKAVLSRDDAFIDLDSTEGNEPERLAITPLYVDLEAKEPEADLTGVHPDQWLNFLGDATDPALIVATWTDTQTRPDFRELSDAKQKALSAATNARVTEIEQEMAA